MIVCYPISVTPNDVYVFFEEHGRLGAARIATDDIRFVGLPESIFKVNGIFPLYPDTGEPIPGFRWANTDDMQENSYIFNAYH